MKVRDRFFKSLIIFSHISTGIIGLMIACAIWITIQFGLPRGQELYLVNETLDVMGLFVVLIILFSIVRDMRYSGDPDHSKIWYSIVLIINAFGLFSDYFSWRVQGVAQYAGVNLLANEIFYICGPLIIYGYWKYCECVIGKQDSWNRVIDSLQSIIGGITVIAVLLNTIFGYFFTVSEQGEYARSHFYYMCVISNLAMVLMALIYLFRSKLTRKQKILLAIFGIAPFIAYVIQLFFFGLSINYMATLCAALLVFANIQAKRAQELNDQRMKVIQSQLQPHFFYNTMISIRALIKKSPPEAVEAMDHFIGYLRGSVDMFEVENMIPVEQELKFVQDYLEIEKVRFGENIQYSIDNEVNQSFLIPPLAIQPMVENAIRHGIRKRMDGVGSVRIHLYMDKKNYYIDITDDGVGFDINAPRSTERSHIGLSNTARRIEVMLEGRLTVDSVMDEGTTIHIEIPIKKAKIKV